MTITSGLKYVGMPRGCNASQRDISVFIDRSDDLA